MSLLDWPADWSLEAEIRAILVKEHATDLSLAACKAWARQFIQDLLPHWEPGTPMDWEEAAYVGAMFERYLHKKTHHRVPQYIHRGKRRRHLR